MNDKWQLLRSIAFVGIGVISAGFSGGLPASQLPTGYVPVQDNVTVELPQGDDIDIPLPESIFRAIVPLEIAPQNASLNEMLDQGRVEKWMKPVVFHFMPDTPEDEARLIEIFRRQTLPLMTEISEATGVKMRSAENAKEIDVLIIFASDAAARRQLLPLASMRELLNSPMVGISSAFAKAYEFDNSDCLHLLSKSVGEIYGAFGFVSTRLSPAEQETCMAKVLLYIMGLQGEARLASAGKAGNPPGKLSLLDAASLNVLYEQQAKPNMTWRNALKSTNSVQ